MSQNRPSYGVFMVDIFASSVGIFILVSLLYIIESAKATSNEAMVERFKTLIKRDLVPVDRYSLPVNNDPLHDWGVRARHAREKQEALILLLRDKVLLYHNNQLLNTQQIVDSDIILNYYKKYNKNRRLFIEIHYHDAYHTLKAKIDEALPENVHQWVHWAYNAGNINNPNPVSQQASRPNIDMTPNGRDDDPIDPDELAIPSSVGGGASSRGTSATSGDPNATDSQNGSEQGQGESDGLGENQGQGKGQGENTGADNGANTGLGEGEQNGDSSQNQLSQEQQAVQNALKQLNTMQDFIEQLMQSPDGNDAISQTPQSNSNNGKKAGSQSNGSATQSGFGNAPSGSASGNQNSTNQSNNHNTANQNDTRQNSMTSGQPNADPKNADENVAEQIAKENELVIETPEDEQQQALNLIRKNVFLRVPLHSPIDNFNIDIKVPGFTEQNIHLDAVRLKLHQQATTDSKTQRISLQHGDAIIPLSTTPLSTDSQTNQTDLINPLDNRGWLQVKIIKVTAKGAPQQGWIYGLIDGHGIMLPLYENTVQAQGNNDYWYERNNRPLKAFEVTEPPAKQNQQGGR